MSKSTIRKYVVLCAVAATLPIVLGVDCIEFINCDADLKASPQVYPDVNNNILVRDDQVQDATVLVIGDSIMAAYHGPCINSGGGFCHKGIGDDTSVEIDEYVRTEAIPGAGLHIKKCTDETPPSCGTIPDQYCMATRGDDAVWDWDELKCCDPSSCEPAVEKAFDWVILNGGGNDLENKCKQPKFLGFPVDNPPCDSKCAQTATDLFWDMANFLSYVYGEAHQPEIILFGPYRVQHDSIVNYYNDCADLVNGYCNWLIDPGPIHFIHPEDWVADEGAPETSTKDNYQNFPFYYSDTLHPTHDSVGLISKEIAGIISPPSP